MSVTIQLRRDLAANWASADPVLNQGELGLETDTGHGKLGDGATAWNSLGYWSTGGGSGAISSVFGRTGAVVAVSGDYSVGEVTGAAPLASPALTGTPTAPTATPGDSTTKIATDAFVTAAVAVETTRAEAAETLLAPLASAALTGSPTAPTPSGPTGIANKAYVDSTSQGLDGKPSARVIATSNITLSGLQTIDGTALSSGDRVLAAGQSTSSQNGLWVAASSGWARPADFATGSIQQGTYVFIEAGTVNFNSGWMLTGGTPVTVDTSAQAWTQFSGAGEITAGAGLAKSGNTLSVATSGAAAGSYANTSLTVGADGRVTAVASGATPLPESGGTMTGALAPAVVTLAASGGTFSINASLGNVFILPLTAAGMTVSSPASPAGDGQIIRLRLVEDATGGRTIGTWGSEFDWGSTSGTPNSAPALSTAPNATDTLAFEWDAATSKWCSLGAPFPQGF